MVIKFNAFEFKKLYLTLILNKKLIIGLSYHPIITINCQKSKGSKELGKLFFSVTAACLDFNFIPIYLLQYNFYFGILGLLTDFSVLFLA